jgi:hypothetical protein
MVSDDDLTCKRLHKKSMSYHDLNTDIEGGKGRRSKNKDRMII